MEKCINTRFGGDLVNLGTLCQGVKPSCPRIKSQEKFIDGLSEAAGSKLYISASYKKALFNGNKDFPVNQKEPLREKDNFHSLIAFFENEIDDVEKALVALGIPEKDEPNKKALSIALAQQMKVIIDSDENDVDNILVMQYQQAKYEANVQEDYENMKPLYLGDSVSVYQTTRYEIASYDSVTHIWELVNTGNIVWTGRKLVYKRGPKDRPEANPDIIDIPDVKPHERIKITTTINGRGFDGVTHCKWEMQDVDGQNCFPGRALLFCVTIDAMYKRN